MNRIEEQLEKQLKELRDINLPEEARSRMRAELLSYAQLHAVSAAAKSVRSPFAVLRLRVYAGLSAAVLLIAALGGTAYASESALPGDALYPVKVGFTEPLQGALIPSDRGRAAWHAILAERRLEETAQLAAEGKLSTSTQDVLAANFNDQVSASQDSADRLEHDGDASGSLSARSDLEARLAAHMQILSIIDHHYAAATSTDAVDTHQALSRMLALVENHEQAVASSRIALEDQIAPNGAQDDQGQDGTTTVIAAAIPASKGRPAKHGRMTLPIANEPPVAEIETTASARTSEVQDILERHAALLQAFLPSASTTATSTATSTATTTIPVIRDSQDQPDSGSIQHGLFDGSATGTFRFFPGNH